MATPVSEMVSGLTNGLSLANPSPSNGLAFRWRGAACPLPENRSHTLRPFLQGFLRPGKLNEKREGPRHDGIRTR